MVGSILGPAIKSNAKGIIDMSSWLKRTSSRMEAGILVIIENKMGLEIN
jgi:hypothetical protein